MPLDKNVEPSKLDNHQLVFVHMEVHRAYGSYLKGRGLQGWSKEDYYNVHKLISEEMKRRSLTHNVINELDYVKIGQNTEDEELMIDQPTLQALDQWLDNLHNSCKEKITRGMTEEQTKEVVAGCLYEFLPVMPKGVQLTELIARMQFHKKMQKHNFSIAIELLQGGDVKLQEDKPLAPVLASGNVQGPEVALEEVLKHFKPFRIAQPMVYLTGGIVNNGRTMGDIDILIRTVQTDPIVVPLQFRISRMFPPEVRERLHFLFEDTTLGMHVPGPYTSFIPLFGIDASLIEPFEKVTMAEKVELAVVLGKPFKPLKPLIGYKVGEFFGLDALREVWKDADFPAVVQKKYDGNHVLFHKDGVQVIIFSDDEHDITNRLPTFVQIVQGVGWPAKMILDIELEMWVDGKHQSRENASGYLNTAADAQPGEDKVFVANAFDIVWVDESSLADKPYAERLRVLMKLPIKQRTNDVPQTSMFNLTPSVRVATKDELIEAVKQVADTPGSEGAVIKSLDMRYQTSGQPKGFVKYKLTEIYRVVAIEKIETKTPNVYNYGMGVPIMQGWKPSERDIFEVGGIKYMYVGKTMNTVVNILTGTTLRVSAENVFIYGNKERLRLYVPTVVEAKPGDQPDSPDTVLSIAFEKGKLVEKKTSELEEKDLDEYELQQYPPKEQAYPYVLQVHFRGKSAHHDFRTAINDHLEGWTIFSQPENKVIEEPKTISEGKSIIEKVDWKWPTVEGRAQVRKKSNQPKEWLEIEQVFGPSTVGATSEKQGVMVIIDKGMLEFGARKPWFFEYFLHGDELKGRLIMRQVGEPSRQDITDVRSVGYWISWQPEDQAPYVLSKQAIQDSWVPPQGFSALPNELKQKVPPLFRYWEESDHEKRLQMRNQYSEKLKSRLSIVKDLGDGRLLLQCLGCNDPDCTTIYVGTSESKQGIVVFEDLKSVGPATTLLEKNFILSHHWWKGQFVTRAGPSVEHWDMFIDGVQTVMEANPLEQSTSLVFRKPYTRTFKDKGASGAEFIKPGEPGNPTKNTPSWIEQLDNGVVEVIEDTDQFKRYRFKGQKMQGVYAFKREDPRASLWRFERAQMPGEKLSLSKNEDFEKIQLMVPVSTYSTNDGRLNVEGLGLSWGVWNGEYFPPEVINDEPQRVMGIPVVFGSHQEAEVKGKVVEYGIVNNSLWIKTTLDDPEDAMRKQLENKNVRGWGFSVEVAVKIDRVRRIVTKILEYQRVAIVPNPACKVCVIGVSQ